MKEWWRKPEAPGLELIDMHEVSLDDLDSHAKPRQDETGKILVNLIQHDNDIRAEGIDPSKSADFCELIIEGEYLKYYYVPPVITTDNKIVAGETRYVAHGDAGEKTMFCAIVKFVDYDGRSAAYWQKMYQSNENAGKQREITGNNRTEKDLIHFTTLLANNPEVEDVWWDEDNNYKSIRSALKDQGYTDSKKITSLIQEILFLGERPTKAVRGYTKNRVKNEIASEMLKNSKLEQPNDIRLMENTTGYDPDYDYRLFKDIVQYILSCIKKGIEPDVYKVVLYWKGLTSQQLEDVHKGKQNLFHDIYIVHKKCIEVYESGDLEKYVEIKYKGQTSDEKIYSNYTPTMNYKQDYEKIK